MFKIVIILNLLLLIQISFSASYYITSQAQFDSTMDQIGSDLNRKYWSELTIDIYDGNQHDITDMSKISVISECVNLTFLRLEIGRSPYGQNSFDQTMNAIRPMTKLTRLLLMFYDASTVDTELNNINGLKPILEQLSELTYLQLQFSVNKIPTCECFSDMFDGMTELVELRLYLNHNQLTTMDTFINSFQYATKIKILHLSAHHNNIQNYTLHDSFINLTVLDLLYLYFSPRANDEFSQYNDFHVKNDNLRKLGVFSKKGVYNKENCQDIFATKYLPRLYLIKIYHYECWADISNWNYYTQIFEKIPTLGQINILTYNEFNEKKIAPISHPYTKIMNFQFNSCGFTDETIQNFHYIYKSLSGRDLENLYIYARYNNLSDLTGLSTAINQFVFTYIQLRLYNSQISDFSHLYTLLDGQKETLTHFYFMVQGNSALNDKQEQINEILLPISYYGKSTIQYLYMSFIDPVYDTYYYENYLNTKGKYPALSNKGVCWSDFEQATYFHLVDNQKTCTNCYTKLCHSCFEGQSKCEKCRYSQPAREIDNDCKCPIHYYDGENYECLECQDICKTCDNNKSCLTCFDSNPPRLQGSCLCPSGYYDDGQNSQCQSCLEQCDKCQNKVDCLQCQDGWYLSDDKTTCIKCLEKFETCSDQNTGIVCKGKNRSNELPCNCLSGYFDEQLNKADCKECKINCSICDSPENCQQCKDSYYLDQLNTCIKCPLKYKKCTNESTGIECQGEGRNMENFQTCECSPNYYENEESDQKDCTQCESPCINCTSQSTCQSCIDGYYLIENTCIKCPLKYKLCTNQSTGIECQGEGRNMENFQTCECSVNYYENEESDQKDCTQCESPCINCTSQQTCQSCIDGYYLKENTCIKCPLKYKKCTNESTGIECQGEGRIMENFQTCECSLNYYENKDTDQKDCTQCESPCINCTSQQTCQSCIDGYYLKENTCIKCPLKYKKCTNEVYGIVCQGLNRTQNLPNCECQNNFYNSDSQLDCLQCQSPCYNCIDSQTCLSCIAGTYLIENTCLECPIQFSKCENETTGISCQGFYRNEAPSCSCKDTYYQKDGIMDCIECVNPCINCISELECTSCIEGYYLKQKQCILCSDKFIKCQDELYGSECNGTNRSTPNCDCKANYFEQQDSKDCKICVDQCSICMNTTTCINCQDVHYLEDNKCKQCSKQFSKCVNAEIGQRCAGNFRQQIIPECPCQEGYYDNGINIDCQICQSPCNTCQFSKISCLTCIQGYYLDQNICKICTGQDLWRLECQSLDKNSGDNSNATISSTDDSQNQKISSNNNQTLYALGAVVFFLWWILLLLAYYIYRKYIKKQQKNQVEDNMSNKSGQIDITTTDDKSNIGLNKQQSYNNKFINTQISLNTEQNLNDNTDILDLENNSSSPDIKQNQINSLQRKSNVLNIKKITDSSKKQLQQSQEEIKQKKFQIKTKKRKSLTQK